MKILSRPKRVKSRVVHFNLKRTALLAAILAAALTMGLLSNTGTVSAAATSRLLPIYSVERDSKCVSLTFDAAWGNEDTQTLIDILGTYGVKATFFVVGDWVDKYPESVKALADAGHEVMNHSDDHAHFTKLSSEDAVKNITLCNEKIKSVTGKTPTLFRAPYGEYDDKVIAAVNGLGMTAVQWDVDSLDWKEYDAPTITERVMGKVGAGSIILFHNAALHTPEALPGIIEKLIQEGYSIVPVSELILKGDCVIDHTGRQMKAK